ncbi:hypothetical protein TWF506_004614 [Arthrobotrys conoides]|uniref:F-box domain-containing protein n=1 Tax=Arthrobotrys conoides TaxID=74498 RepID=A0AAN8N2E6_9PEZI
MHVASLPTLPQELINQISTSLPDQDDLLSLRLTNKSLNHKFHDPHLTSIYQCRRIFFVPRSLHNLLKIATDPSGIGNRVQYLKFADSNPYFKIPSFPPASETDSNDVISRRSAKERLVTAGKEFRKEAKVMIALEQDIKILVGVFRNLKNLKGVEIEKFSELPRRWEMNLLYPSLGVKPGCRVPEFMGLIKKNDIRAVGYNTSRRVITAALTAGIKGLERLSNTYSTVSDAFSHNWFDESVPLYSLFPIAFPNLRALEISVCCKGVYSSQPAQSSERNVCEWLEGLGATLEELRFEYLLPAVNLRRMTILPDSRGLPRLKVLRLRSIRIEVGNLLRLLESCKDSLQELKLLSCRTFEVKEGGFRLLKFLRGEVKRLRIFEVGFKDDLVLREGYYPVKVFVNGDWKLDTTKIVVRTKVRQTVFRGFDELEVVVYDRFGVEKSVRKEVDDGETADGFWRGLLDGKWDEWDAVDVEVHNYRVDGLDAAAEA